MSSQRAEAQETELLQKAAEQTNANHEVKTPRGFDVKNMRQSVWHLHVHVPRFDAVLAQTVPPDDPLGR